jgi:hypothetical protein
MNSRDYRLFAVYLMKRTTSPRKLRRGAANLLAGRLTELHMHPFMAAELGSEFNMQRSLEIGLVPLIWSSPEPFRRTR